MVKEGRVFQAETKKRNEPRKRFYMFFPGAGATYKGISGLRTEFANKYGPKNIIVYNSILSPEAPSPNRYEEMGELIQNKIKKKTPITVVAHCLGAAEFQTAVKTVEENTKHFFDDPDHVKNINTVLISPSGFFKGWKGAAEYLRRVYNLACNEMNFPIISNQSSGVKGLISVNTFLPENISRSTMVKGIRNAFSNLSQFKENLPEVEFIPSKDYNPYLPREIRKKIQKIDEQLKKAFIQADNKAIKMLLSLRGIISGKELDKAYSGEYFNEQDSYQKTIQKWSKGGLSKLGKVLSDMFQGKPMEKIKELKKKGMHVSFIVPEYDVLVPIKEVFKFFNNEPVKGEKNLPIKQFPLETHATSITTVQSSSLVEAVKE